jgi:hypothetical protein
MTTLLAAPWYFLAAFCLFGGALIGCALWWLLVNVADGWPVEIDGPHDYFADETRDPSKE